MRFLALFTVAVVFAYTANGQTCNCESNFEWVKKTFEENDAGFQYTIDKKGQAAYDIHNQLMLQKIKEAKTLTECSILLNEWLKFFRTGHIGIQLNMQTSNDTVGYETETWKGDISKFEKYVATKKDADFEGVWEVSSYKIGIKREGTNYIGFIIESGVESWKQGMIKLKIEQSDDTLESIFYMRDHSPVESKNPKLLGKIYLQIGQFVLKRLSPVFPREDQIDFYYESMNAQKPYLEELGTNTLYFRIPSFEINQKAAIDSVIDVNKDKILNTENLIIDVRNNGGGGDKGFEKLIPFLYTNPIRIGNVEFLSTPLKNQPSLEESTAKKDLLGYDIDEAYLQFTKNISDKLQSKKHGEFVPLFNEDINIISGYTVYPYPKNVGIIIDGGCASATEQFLYEAKQSKKVKLFGTHTFGTYDISNVNFVESPCKEFFLTFGMSRNILIRNGYTIDGIGFQPDYFLDESIPQYRWVEFVYKILNQ